MSSNTITHKNLDIWKRGIKFVEQIYLLTGQLPKEETYGLISQLRRAAVSFPSNIAEGAARASKREYIQFLYIALGSLSEIETQLIITGNLGYLKAESMLKETEVIRKMTISFIRYLKNKK
jgi:four helix bundle protein